MLVSVHNSKHQERPAIQLQMVNWNAQAAVRKSVKSRLLHTDVPALTWVFYANSTERQS